MSKMMETKDDDWSLYLEDTVFSINTSVQATTKVTPFEMMFGRKARFPLQAEFISANECQEDRCNEIDTADQEIQHCSMIKYCIRSQIYNPGRLYHFHLARGNHWVTNFELHCGQNRTI